MFRSLKISRLKQGKQSTCNVRLKPFRVTIVAVQKHELLYIICSLSYPECKAHAPYYIIIYGLWIYLIVTDYLINGTSLGKKKVIVHKMCFGFLYKFYLKNLLF